VAAAVTGAKLASVVGVRRLLIAGLSLLAIAALLLTRIPAGGHYAKDLLPALLIAGVAGGLAAPAAQIAALSGITHSMTGLASGLIETMREIGGAIGVAAVSTILISRASEIAGAADPSARGLAAANAFHTAYWVIFGVAALGALTAGVAFPRRATQQPELDAALSRVSIVTEPMKESA
jgi:MFS family permease